MVSLAQKRKAAVRMQEQGLSCRRSCQLLALSLSSYYYRSTRVERDKDFIRDVREMAFSYPRFGYRRIAVMLKVSDNKVYRVWKDLSLPKKRKRKRVGISSEAREVQAMAPHHVWSYDILHDRLRNGRQVKCLCVVDEYTRECLGIEVLPTLKAKQVIDCLKRLIDEHGKPDFIRSDNGSQFTSRAVMVWLGRQYIKTQFIEPGKPWQNGFVESFHARLRDECLNRYLFETGKQAKALIEHWRQFYNQQRPHSAIGYQTPTGFKEDFYTKLKRAQL